MNPSEMIRLVDAIARERNVEKEMLYTDIEQAMVSAARKHFNAIDTEDFTCELDRITGKIHIWRGEDEIPLEELGRIPAQTAKQVMIQRFREDERDSIYGEFIDRVGELTTGMAQRYEGGSLIVQIGRAEGFMPRSEQIPGEQHAAGERVRCFILDVRESGSQVKIVLSRAHPDFIRRLFEVEVPEVAERIIEIKGMAREAGHRTKIAVASMDNKVDAVGACVGVRGSRIKNIVDELGGEKIDIVRWNESSQILIANALKPAEVVEISLCFELGRSTVVVNEDQLSLAIGKRGQNVRLAARLTNWDVDILTPAEFAKGLETMEKTFTEMDGLDETHVDKLAALGVISVFDIEEVGVEYLQETLGVDEELATKMVVVAGEKAKVVQEQQQKDKEEAEQKRKQAQEAQAKYDASQPGTIDDLLGGKAADAGGPIGSGVDSSSILDILEERQKDNSEAPSADAAASSPVGADDDIVTAALRDGEEDAEPSEAVETHDELIAREEAEAANDKDALPEVDELSGEGGPDEPGSNDVIEMNEKIEEKSSN